MMINDDLHYDDKNSGGYKMIYLAFDLKDRMFDVLKQYNIIKSEVT